MKHFDLVGKKFYRLYVLERSEQKYKNGNYYWNCICDCGKNVNVIGSSLTSGNTKSCGCYHKEQCSGVEDLTNKRFGRLKVLNINIKSNKCWDCICDCGNKKTVRADSLKTTTKSCGCYHKDQMKFNVLPNGGAAKNKLYGSYKNKAGKRGYEFLLTKEEFLHTTSQCCYYCGVENSLNFVSKKSVYICNGIDRIDNNIGYIAENVVPCCSTCNYAKRTMSKNDFLNWINSVYNYQNEKAK